LTLAAANGGNVAPVKSDTEIASDDGKRELVDANVKVQSAVSDSHVSDNNACLLADDDDDDPVLFNGDVVCSEHGKAATQLFFYNIVIFA